jgi:hypothetical protein
LIHYDEKWFWGLVRRKGARACEELGIDPYTFEAYHNIREVIPGSKLFIGGYIFISLPH